MVEDTFDHTRRKDLRRGTYVPKEVSTDEIIQEILNGFPGTEKVERKGNRMELRVRSTLVAGILSKLKTAGFDHFVALTCIDMIEDDQFELVYHLFSYGARVHIFIKTGIEREKPSMESLVEVFRPAITYEREIREMFGVDFPGNPRLTDFILEDWQGPPPMRKDFDSIRYVQDEFEMKVRNPKALPPKWKKEGDQ